MRISLQHPASASQDIIFNPQVSGSHPGIRIDSKSGFSLLAVLQCRWDQLEDTWTDCMSPELVANGLSHRRVGPISEIISLKDADCDGHYASTNSRCGLVSLEMSIKLDARS